MIRSSHPWACCAALALCLAAAASFAEPVAPLSRVVAAVERAESLELAKLQAAIAASDDQAEILGLQNCAAYVKLAGRLALCEESRLRATEGAQKYRLAGAAEILRLRLEGLAPTLPEGYRYDPRALANGEATSCAE